jgi:hypothetical protein
LPRAVPPPEGAPVAPEALLLIGGESVRTWHRWFDVCRFDVLIHFGGAVPLPPLNRVRSRSTRGGAGGRGGSRQSHHQGKGGGGRGGGGKEPGVDIVKKHWNHWHHLPSTERGGERKNKDRLDGTGGNGGTGEATSSDPSFASASSSDLPSSRPTHHHNHPQAAALRQACTRWSTHVLAPFLFLKFLPNAAAMDVRAETHTRGTICSV